MSVLHEETDLAFSQLVGAGVQEGGLMHHLAESLPAGHVCAWVCQGQPAPIQDGVDRVHDGGVESFRVVVACFIHPSLAGGKYGVISFPSVCLNERVCRSSLPRRFLCLVVPHQVDRGSAVCPIPFWFLWTNAGEQRRTWPPGLT